MTHTPVTDHAAASEIGVLMVPGPEERPFQGGTIPGGPVYAWHSLVTLARSEPGIVFHAYIAVERHQATGIWMDLPGNLLVREVPIHSTPENKVDLSISSNQHGASLDVLFAVAAKKFQYVIILDPDSFILRKGLISDLVADMARGGEAFAGVPYPYFYPFDYATDYPTLYFLILRPQLLSGTPLSFLPDQSQTMFGGSPVPANLKRRFAQLARGLISRASLNEGLISLRSPFLSRNRICAHAFATRLVGESGLAGDTGHSIRSAAKTLGCIVLPSIAITEADDRRGSQVVGQMKFQAGRAIRNLRTYRRALEWSPRGRFASRIWRASALESWLPRLNLNHRPECSTVDEIQVTELEEVRQELHSLGLPDLADCMLYGYGGRPAVLHFGHQGKRGLTVDVTRANLVWLPEASDHVEGFGSAERESHPQGQESHPQPEE